MMGEFGALFWYALCYTSLVEEDRRLWNLLQIEPERVDKLLLDAGGECIKQSLATHVRCELLVEVRQGWLQGCHMCGDVVTLRLPMLRTIPSEIVTNGLVDEERSKLVNQVFEVKLVSLGFTGYSDDSLAVHLQV